MKKLFLISVVVLFGTYSSQTQAQIQDTIIGLTAITGTLDDTVANIGIPLNLPPTSSCAIRTIGGTAPITITNGQVAGDYACTATGWDNGMDTKYWEIGFKTGGASNLLLSYKQRAGGNYGGGPRDFKAQYKIDTNGTWLDIPGAVLVCANDWSAAISDIPLPSNCNMINQTLFIRWIMTSNDNITGSTVTNTAVSKIDEIFVKADIGVGTEIIYERNAVSVYPNPSSGIFKLQFLEKINFLTICDFMGNIISSQSINSDNYIIDLSGCAKGIYLITARESLSGINYCRKIILE